MSSLHHRILFPRKYAEYEIPTGDTEGQRARAPSESNLMLCRQVFTFRNLITTFALLVSAIFISDIGRIPSSYSNVRQFERNLPQHNAHFSRAAGIRYLVFPRHIWGHGWNNVLQETLMLSYLAYITNRSYVFDDYTWSHSPLPLTIHGLTLRPTRIPLNAFISGPIAGGSISKTPKSPRSVHVEFYRSVCSQGNRRVINFTDNMPRDIWGRSRVEWWKHTIGQHQDAICLEINVPREMMFDFTFFEDQEILDIWPSLSQSAIFSGFKWSPLVISAVHRNFAVLSNYDGIGTNSRSKVDLHNNESTGRAPLPTPETMYPGLLALHVRRGDYTRHCLRLADSHTSFHSFNSFDYLLDRWVPYTDSMEIDKYEYYRKRCLPTPDEIVKRLRTIRDEYDASDAGEGLELNAIFKPPRRLTRVYVLSNAWHFWLEGLKRKLVEDGWEDVIFGADLMLDREQRGVDMAVDMNIAESAEVFVGNGFSSLSGNIAMLRTVKGLDKRTNRLL